MTLDAAVDTTWTVDTAVDTTWPLSSEKKVVLEVEIWPATDETQLTKLPLELKATIALAVLAERSFLKLVGDCDEELSGFFLIKTQPDAPIGFSSPSSDDKRVSLVLEQQGSDYVLKVRVAPDGLAGDGKAELRLEIVDYAYMRHIPFTLQYAFEDLIQVQPQTLIFSRAMLSKQAATASISQSSRIRHKRGLSFDLEGPVGNPSSVFDVDIAKEVDGYKVTATLKPAGTSVAEAVSEAFTFHALEGGRKREFKLTAYVQGTAVCQAKTSPLTN